MARAAKSATSSVQAKQQRKFSESYTLHELLGEGGFAQVRRCTHKTSGTACAAKIFDLKKCSRKDIEALKLEANVMRKLSHPNIVRIYASLPEGHQHYFVLELLEGGELFDEIVARDHYSEVDASNCIKQVLEAIEHCHKNNVCHRDIKPENLLLSGQKKKVKLADFGLACEYLDDERKWSGLTGTPGYMSPEMCAREPYGKPVDLWAAGVILFILLCGYTPFWNDDQDKLYKLIRRAKIYLDQPEWSSVTDEAKDLVAKLLERDPDLRMTAVDALAHPWVSHSSKYASRLHRPKTLKSLKMWNARRKLRAAILAMVAAEIAAPKADGPTGGKARTAVSTTSQLQLPTFS